MMIHAALQRWACFRSVLLVCILFVLLSTGLRSVGANPDAKRLYDDLLRKSGYNKLIRPVGNNTDKLTVKLGLRLSQLIDVVSITTKHLSYFHALIIILPSTYHFTSMHLR